MTTVRLCRSTPMKRMCVLLLQRVFGALSSETTGANVWLSYHVNRVDGRLIR
jgi:hypothetical protein